MAFKMKGMNFGKGTGSASPMKQGVKIRDPKNPGKEIKGMRQFGKFNRQKRRIRGEQSQTSRMLNIQEVSLKRKKSTQNHR